MFPDITLVGQFEIVRENPALSEPVVAWLDRAIYVTYNNLRSVRVFNGETPFHELPPIRIDELEMPQAMVACAWMHCICISEKSKECIWKIDIFKDNLVNKMDVDWKGTPLHLSITPDNELLAVVERPCPVHEVDDDLQFEFDSSDNFEYIPGESRAFYYLEICLLTDDTREESMCLPRLIDTVECVVQLPDKNFVISYQKDRSTNEFFISLLSENGKIFIWTLDPTFFPPDYRTKFNPYYFVLDGDGDILLADKFADRIVYLNLKNAEYILLSTEGYQPNKPTQMVFRKEVQCLLVQDNKITDQPASHYNPVVSVLRLQNNTVDDLH